MRHAITKLAHLHFAATKESGERILRFGEPPSTVHVVGSPAIDGLDVMPPLDDAQSCRLGESVDVLLLHGAGLPPATERPWVEVGHRRRSRHGPVAVLRPNQDPGSEFVEQAHRRPPRRSRMIQVLGHLDRPAFIGLLRRAEVLVGNSSAGLIEAAALGCPAVNLGPRQAGRERPGLGDRGRDPGRRTRSRTPSGRHSGESPASTPTGVEALGVESPALLAESCTRSLAAQAERVLISDGAGERLRTPRGPFAMR